MLAKLKIPLNKKLLNFKGKIMIKNYPDKNSIKFMNYSELLALRKSLKSKIIIRKRALKQAIENKEHLKKLYPEPKNALEHSYVVMAENESVNINAEIVLLNNLLSEVEKYLNPMLEQISNAKQFGEK